MTNPRRHDAKDKKREERIGLRKARRLRAQQCDRLLFEAEAEWRAERPERAERLLDNVVQINPHYTEAYLHLAELCFVARRFDNPITGTPEQPGSRRLAVPCRWCMGKREPRPPPHDDPAGRGAQVIPKTC
jgi:hypothetical protein